MPGVIVLDKQTFSPKGYTVQINRAGQKKINQQTEVIIKQKSQENQVIHGDYTMHH